MMLLLMLACEPPPPCIEWRTETQWIDETLYMPDGSGSFTVIPGGHYAPVSVCTKRAAKPEATDVP